MFKTLFSKQRLVISPLVNNVRTCSNVCFGVYLGFLCKARSNASSLPERRDSLGILKKRPLLRALRTYRFGLGGTSQPFFTLESFSSDPEVRTPKKTVAKGKPKRAAYSWAGHDPVKAATERHAQVYQSRRKRMHAVSDLHWKFSFEILLKPFWVSTTY